MSKKSSRAPHDEPAERELGLVMQAVARDARDQTRRLQTLLHTQLKEGLARNERKTTQALAR